MIKNAFGFMMLAQSVCFGAVITVDSSSPGGLGTQGCTLHEAIVAANVDDGYGGCAGGSGADTIRFASSVTVPIELNASVTSMGAGLPAIVSDITIEGTPTTIEVASGAYVRMFDINDTGHLTLRDMTLRGGHGVGYGGAILMDGGALTLDRSSLIENTAERKTIINESFISQGGAVSLFGGTLSCVSSTINANFAEQVGGGVLADANSVLVLDHCTLANNQAAEGGGALHVIGDTTLRFTEVTGNTATNGAGLYASGALGITDSTIAQNVASGSGGGAYLDGAEALITHSTFSGNVAQNGDGAALYHGSGITTILNATFSENTTQASAKYGAGIFNASSGVLTLKNATIADNYGKENGVGLYNEGALMLYNTVLANSFSAKPVQGFPVLLRDDVYGNAPDSGSGNLIERVAVGWSSVCVSTAVDPMLEVLGDYGGATLTRALKKDSPAINSANQSTCSDTALRFDQRHFTRDRHCDIGAFEFQNFSKTLPAILYLLQ